MLCANPNLKINIDDLFSCNPLSQAAIKGYDESIRLLLQHGADVNTGIEVGRTPLGYAVMNRHSSTVRLLIDSRANVNAKVSGGGRLIDLCKIFSAPDIEELLRKAGAKTGAELDAQTATSRKR